VEPYRSLFINQEHYDRALLMSHLCAYRTAAAHAKDKRLLEIGSGAGYGAYYLGHIAREVVAIDQDRALIEQAQRLFQRQNLTFLHMDGTRLAFPDGHFDVVGLFQVIEHIPEEVLPVFLRDIARVLTPEGCVVVSTLNLDHNRKGKVDYVKPSFHVKEFTARELRTLLESIFPTVELYGLYPRWRYRLMCRLKKWGLDRLGSPARNSLRRFLDTVTTDDHELRLHCNPVAIDLVAICRRRPTKI